MVVAALIGVGLAIRYNVFGKFAVKEMTTSAGKPFKVAEEVPGLLQKYIIQPLREFAEKGLKLNLSSRDAKYAEKMGQSLFHTEWWINAFRPLADMMASAVDWVRQPFVRVLTKDAKFVPLAERPGWYEVAGFAAAAAVITGFFGVYKTLFPHGLSPGYKHEFKDRQRR